MALNQYVGNHKQWDHVGSITPDFEISEGIRPAEELKPAAWLPVLRFDKYYEEWFVVSAGKAVALDADGNVVPAQYRTETNNIVYTADDVAAGTVDVRTGAALLIGAIGTFAVSTVSDFMGRGLDMGDTEAGQVSAPIGFAPYNYWQWAGGDGFNPSQYRKHNHNLQHQVAVLCDFYVELPYVPAAQSAEALDNASQYGTKNVYSFIAIDNLPVAKNTSRTPFVFAEGAGVPADVATRFVNEVATIDDIISSGDYFMDYDTGILSVYATGAPGDTDYTIAYYHYAGTANSTNNYACANGVLSPGDFVKADANSNLTLWVEGTDAWSLCLGQILAVDTRFPKDALEKVRTAYAGLGVEQQMPGSANGGVPANISYSGAANAVVRINLINR